MPKKRLIKSVVGPISTNCYILCNDDTREAVIIDPGDEADLIMEAIDSNKLSPVAILLTHGHYDHVIAAKDISDRYDIKIYAGINEKETLEDPKLNQTAYYGRTPCVYSADIYVEEDTILSLAGFDIKVINTPGHTIGGVCYLVLDENLLFSGDTLFYHAVGRTDFLKGSATQLINGIKDKLMVLEDDCSVYPGHGLDTTIGEERISNPYIV